MESMVLQTPVAASTIYLAADFSELTAVCRAPLASYPRVIAIIDATVQRLHGHLFPFPKIEIPATETTKTLATVENILQQLLAWHVDRDCLLLGVGGGIVTDICGFVAAIYKRGLPCAFVPTTFLAMIDAAVGGKNGVNAAGFKNMIGTVRQPQQVFICPEFLTTLPETELRHALPELLKMWIIGNKDLTKLADFQLDKSLPLIREAVKIKAAIVAADEEDRGGRRVLNLGHTFAHAIERCSHYAISHGEAVGIGLCLAAKNGGNPALAAVISQLLQQWNLRTQIPNDIVISDLEQAVGQDKKNVDGQIQLVVVPADNQVQVLPTPLEAVIWQ